MYTDLISYQLADGVSEEQLREVCERVYREWMRDLPGFVKWEIHRAMDGTFTDVVRWESREYAKASEEKMSEVPNLKEWQACYDMESIKNKQLSRVIKFHAPGVD